MWIFYKVYLLRNYVSPLQLSKETQGGNFKPEAMQTTKHLPMPPLFCLSGFFVVAVFVHRKSLMAFVTDLEEL